MPTFKELTQFFQDIGADDVPHTQKSYLAHGIGVYRDLKAWGCDEELCQAGLFHSIYGTQIFQGFTLPVDRRGQLQEMIGKRAEWLAYINCFMDRETFDAQVLDQKEMHPIKHRVTGEVMTVLAADFEDLVRMHLCDWLEQVGRSKNWDYRKKAYQNMAERLGGVALEAFERVYAQALER